MLHNVWYHEVTCALRLSQDRAGTHWNCKDSSHSRAAEGRSRRASWLASQSRACRTFPQVKSLTTRSNKAGRNLESARAICRVPARAIGQSSMERMKSLLDVSVSTSPFHMSCSQAHRRRRWSQAADRACQPATFFAREASTSSSREYSVVCKSR